MCSDVTNYDISSTVTHLRDPVLHDLSNVKPCECPLRLELRRLNQLHTGRLANALPQVARDGIRVQVLFQVQRDTLKELVLANELR